MAAKQEPQARKPEGATLDKAIARQHQTAKGKTLAEQHAAECKGAPLWADVALQLAVEADQTANAEVFKMRADVRRVGHL